MAKRLSDFFVEDLKIEDYPMTAITGGGGKTTLMLALVRLLREKGRVAATTTTKLAAAEKSGIREFFIGDPIAAESLAAVLPRRAALTVVREEHDGKLYGFMPGEADALLKNGFFDWVIVEADGSKQLPFKAYETWEPPVPELATLQIVVVGADAFTLPFGKRTAFRAGLLERLYGVKPGGRLTAAKAAEILSSENQYLKNSPKHARRVLLLNKADLLTGAERRELRRSLAQVRGYDLLALLSLKKGVVYELSELRRED